MTDVFDDFRVIDVDTHLTEPPDVWTARVSSKWGDLIPHVERHDGIDGWVIGGNRAIRPGFVTMAGFDGTFPQHPKTFEDFPMASYDAAARLEHLNATGIYAQVLYPNVGGFGSQVFLKLGEPDLMLECVRAYNEFLIDWTSVAPNRLIPVMALPFWDLKACVAEFEFSTARGHRAVLFPSQPQDFGQPALCDPYWDPLWSAIQEAGLSVSFHIGGQDLGSITSNPGNMSTKVNFARMSSLTFIENVKGIAELIFGGVCHRFPDLNFVSVESGVGWLPAVLETFDWQWKNSGVAAEHPEYELLPSEYFRRQIFACFWFEREMIPAALSLYPDNLLYETDFPHPTSMSPGPATPAQPPREYANSLFSGMDSHIVSKVLHDNAARVYHID